MGKNISKPSVSVSSTLRALRLGATALAVAAATLWSRAATAQEAVAACIKASDQGQDLRDQSKLMEARDSFATCARDVCPQQIRAACTEWLSGLGSRIPTLVLAVKDASGHDITTGVLKVDGKTVDGAMTGSAFQVNPGKHTIRVEHPGEDVAEVEVVAREGEQRRLVSVTIGKAIAASGGTSSSTAPGAQAAKGSSGPPVGTWIAGGAGVVAIGVSIGFGVSGLGNYSDFNKCKQPTCTATESSDLRSKAQSQLLISDIFAIAGVVGLGTGALLWILAPSTEPAKASNITWTVGLGSASASVRF